MSKVMGVVMVENKYLILGGFFSYKVFIIIYYYVVFYWI